MDVDNAERLVEAVKADKKWRTALVQNARGVAELFVCPRCLRQHYVSVIVALRERFYELDRTMNSHLRDARPTPAQRAYDAFTKERDAENAYRRFQNKYQKRKEKGWRNMAPMRKEKHDLKEALAQEQARDAERKAELLKVLEAEKARAPPSFAELLRLENCEARMTSLVEITKPRTRGGRHCIHGGRKECPDVGFQKRGSGKEACALLAKLVT